MKKHVIKEVNENSIAEELGIQPNDLLVSINNRPIVDVIDYLYLSADEYVELLIEDQYTHEQVLFEIEKDYDEDIGLSFVNPLLDDAKRCSNNCIFCFVDQLPKGMRKTLYFKDDDSRLSFMHGNFVTLTNVSYEQLDRIVEYHISPINISVHTTDSKLRAEILRNRHAGDVLDKMKILANGNITMNVQIVLMPGINDGEKLKQTIDDLEILYPHVNSIAIVPIGLSKFREGLFEIEPFTKELSLKTINQLEVVQGEMLKKIGTRFAFLSDEFYVNAEYPLPEYEAYEGFIQLEDGIGLMRKFQTEILENLTEGSLKGKYLMISGILAKDYLTMLMKKITDRNDGLTIDVIGVKNDFFGEMISVSGLVTAKDILKQVNNINDYNAAFIPDAMLKADEDIFLDDMSLVELNNRLESKVIKLPVDGKKFLQQLKELS
jgi:putative radical SAM enzyme (TIGR03279 family)